MAKYLLLILSFFIVSCSSTKQTVSTYDKNYSLKDDINKSIIDGFYNGDTIGISKNIYLLK